MQAQMTEIISKLDHLIELQNNIEIIRRVASPIARLEATGGSEVLPARAVGQVDSKQGSTT